VKLGEHRYSFIERPENIPVPVWLSKSGENPFHIGFIVDNAAAVDHAVIECQVRGIKVVIGPRDREDVTERALYCVDPNGYQVEIYCENADA
jgi:catechol 2,3-dioxygenase-like lactoylglutathione lyase family enzyme